MKKIAFAVLDSLFATALFASPAHNWLRLESLGEDKTLAGAPVPMGTVYNVLYEGAVVFSNVTDEVGWYPESVTELWDPSTDTGYTDGDFAFVLFDNAYGEGAIARCLATCTAAANEIVKLSAVADTPYEIVDEAKLDGSEIVVGAGMTLVLRDVRGQSIGGAGNLEVTLSQEEVASGRIALFTAGAAEPTVTRVMYDDEDITEKCVVSGGVLTFTKDASEAETGGIYYLAFAHALDAAADGATVTLLKDLATGDGIALAKSIALAGENAVISGAGFSEAAGKTLTIASGFVGVASLGESYTLTGGKYANNTTFASVAQGYQYAQMAETYEGYNYMVIKASADPMPADARLYAVENATDAGALALSKTELVQKGIVSQDDTPTQISAKLNAEGANKRPTWENVVLGLDNEDSFAKPVPKPVQTDTPNMLKLKLSNLDVSTTSGAKVTYEMMTTTSAGTTTTVAEGLEAEFELPSEGVSYYQFKVTVAPAK